MSAKVCVELFDSMEYVGYQNSVLKKVIEYVGGQVVCI